jgi:hypothetical protein
MGGGEGEVAMQLKRESATRHTHEQPGGREEAHPAALLARADEGLPRRDQHDEVRRAAFYYLFIYLFIIILILFLASIYYLLVFDLFCFVFV